MIKVPELTANDKWKAVIRQVRTFGKSVSPRQQTTLEMLGLTTEVPMRKPIVTVSARKLGYRFMTGEAWWILSGSNRVDQIEPFSKRIANFSDDGLTFFGAYGPRVVDQLSYVVETLLTDQSSRQAVMTIWRSRPGPTKDVPCTVSLQFMVRKNKQNVNELHTFANMRSSDVWLGVPYDWFNFTMISLFVASALMMRSGINVSLGKLFFNAASQHLYDRNFDDVVACLEDDTHAFDYDPIEPIEFADDPYRLLDHLHAIAVGRPQDLKTTMLKGLANEHKTTSGGVRHGRRVDREQEARTRGLQAGWGELSG